MPRLRLSLLLALAAALFRVEGLLAEGPEGTASDAFDRGEAALEEMRPGEAAAFYFQAIEDDAGDYVAHVRYQASALAGGMDIAALREKYDLLLVDYPEHAAAIALHRLRLDPVPERIKALDAMAKAGTGNASDICLELGRAHLAEGRAADALSPLGRALSSISGDRYDVHLLVAEAEFAAGKSVEARRRIENVVAGAPRLWLGHLLLARIDLALGEFEAAVARAGLVLEQRPSLVAAFLVKSEALARSGQLEAAMASLDSATRIAPEAASVVVARADLIAQPGDEKSLETALPLYQVVVGRDPEHVHARYGLGWVFERQKKFPEAEAAYREVLARDPAHVRALNSIGYCLLEQGRISEAQVQFKRAIDSDAEFVTANLNLGATFDMQAKYTESIKIYERVLRMKGQKDNLRALINCAFAHEGNSAFSKAAKLLEHAHSVAPSDANILVWLADNQYFQKKFKQAEGNYRDAVALDAKSFFGWRGLGFCLTEAGKVAEAIEALEKAFALQADAIELLILMGDLLLQDEKLEAAYDKYKAYVDAGGDNPEVSEALRELADELGK